MRKLIIFLVLLGGCGMWQHIPQGQDSEMKCRTSDGYVFYTGQREADVNGLICDHRGMGEG
jgi:hypothetical protein